jgi:hypothetical protein
MPLTPFQAEVFKVIAAHRNPDSYVAGGVVINRDPNSARFSDDIDLFHETSAALEASAERDAEALRRADFVVNFKKRYETFFQASVTRGEDVVRLDWAADSAFRYFPIVPDEVLGFRLHDADAATNKVLAAAGRQKVRDFIDLLQLDRTYISLGVAVWAAAGKDEGFTPDLIMSELRRNCLINPATIGKVTFVHPQTAVTLKKEMLERFDAAEALIAAMPYEPIRCLYVDSTGQPARGSIFDPSWKPHFGSVKGAWPTIGD